MQVFSQNTKKCLECSETKEYAIIFLNCLQGYPLKCGNFSQYFIKRLKIFLEQKFFFLSKSSISGFSCFKNIYVYLYVKVKALTAKNFIFLYMFFETR